MIRKSLKKKRIYENSGNATVPGNVNTAQKDNEAAATEKETNTQIATNNQSPFTAADVENMDADQVLNYVYLTPPENIDDATKQALYKKAEKIRIDRNNGMMTPKETEDMAKNIIADAQAMLRNKSAYGNH